MKIVNPTKLKRKLRYIFKAYNVSSMLAEKILKAVDDSVDIVIDLSDLNGHGKEEINEKVN